MIEIKQVVGTYPDTEYSVVSTGPMGGDAGYGGYTEIKVVFEPSFAVECSFDEASKELKIKVLGDMESPALAQVLDRVAKAINLSFNF